MIRAFPRSGVLLVLTVLLVPGALRADEPLPEAPAPLQIGPVIVNPSLGVRETYTDNAFYSAKDTKGDLITTIIPELKLRLPFGLQELSFGAGAEFRLYSEHSSLNTSPYQLFVLGDFSIGDRVKLKAGDTYQRIEESPLESPNGTSDDYTTNAAALSATYSFVDVAQLRLDYTRVALDYLDSEYRTRDEDLVSLYLYYRVLPNTSAFLEYDFKNVAYDSSPKKDNTVNSGLVGATWEITENSKGTAKTGFLAKNYDDGASDDYSTWIASVDLQHRLSDAAAVRLLAKRDVNEGKYLATRFYTTTGLFADFTYRFLDRLSGVLEGSYAVDKYSEPRDEQTEIREDKTAHVGVGAKYSFTDWLDVVVGYGYSNRNSNFDDLDAVINTVTLKVTAYR